MQLFIKHAFLRTTSSTPQADITVARNMIHDTGRKSRAGVDLFQRRDIGLWGGATNQTARVKNVKK